MKTLSQLLADHRQKQGWSIPYLAEKTKVPSTFIEALEKEKFNDLPAKALVHSYVNLLAHALHIPLETAIAMLRRDLPAYADNDQDLVGLGKITNRRSRLSIKKIFSPAFWLRPTSLALLVVTIALVSAAVFLSSQWHRLGKPPTLVINNLTNAAVISSEYTLTGQTDPQATLTINTEAVSLDTQGRFTHQLSLPPGERTIVVEATDLHGRQSEQVFFVTVE